MPEDTTLDSDLTTPSAEASREGGSRPRTFRGVPLWPLTSGSELLTIQARTIGEDTRVFEAIAFIFIHIHRGDPNAKPPRTFRDDRLVPAKLLWNIDAFRAALLDWADDLNLTAADRAEAIRLHDEILEEKRQSEIEVAPPDSSGTVTGDSPEKKTP